MSGRPVFHNDPESSSRKRVRGAVTEPTEPMQSQLPAETMPSKSQEIPRGRSLSEFLDSCETEEKEPVRTISFRMPESVFQRFELLRGARTRTKYLLHLIEFASETQKSDLP
jgi:hypothetical protein